MTCQRLTPDEAEVIVVLAAAVHDLGLAVHTDPAVSSHGGLVLADRKFQELLDGIYAARERAVLRAEALHAVAAQEASLDCLTLEAGVLTLADALDLTKGRAGLSAEANRRLQAANSVPVVDEVTIQRSKMPPVRVALRLSRADGLPDVAAFLQSKLERVPFAGLVEMMARLENGRAGDLQPIRAWNVAGE